MKTTFAMSSRSLIVLCALCAPASALRPVGRRAAILEGAVACGIAAAAPAHAAPTREKEYAQAAQLQATLATPPSDGSSRLCGSRLVGTYTDPNHKGCVRRVAQIAGTRFASVYGADEDGVPWVAKATVACAGYGGVDAEQLIVDFTPKGGPADVVAVAAYPSSGGATLAFPDGNVWTMVPCSNPNLKTQQQRAACEANARGS